MLKRLYQPHKLTSRFLLECRCPSRGGEGGVCIEGLTEAGTQVTWWFSFGDGGRRMEAGVRG